LDVLVHNAAVPKRRRAQDLTMAEFDHVMRVNLVSPVRMTLAVLPRMLERDRGCIVNVSSLGGRLGILHETAYCASKFALCGWSESLALDLWDTGVDVRLIIPGPIDTEIWDLPDNDDPLYQGDLEPPETVAAGIVAAIEGEAFEHYLPDLKDIAAFKTTDIEVFLAGVAAMAQATPDPQEDQP
jgi:short-subunit dehydrogenase